LVKVEDVVLQHATEDTTGAVTGGWLDLRGSLKPMRLCQKDVGEDASCYIVVGDQVVCKPKRFSGSSKTPILLFDVAANESAFDDDNAEKRLFYVPCLDTQASLDCLLVRLVDVDKKTFERFGVVKCYWDEGREFLEAELDEEIKASLPCLRYEDGLHTIRII
jgi:hypothetical protein